MRKNVTSNPREKGQQFDKVFRWLPAPKNTEPQTAPLRQRPLPYFTRAGFPLRIPGHLAGTGLEPSARRLREKEVQNPEEEIATG